MKALALMLLFSIAAVSRPVIHKIEPPNWWAAHTINPVRLMISGERLMGATVEVDGALTATRVLVNAAGKYAFLDLTIPPDSGPGERRITLRTSEGATSVPFPVLAQLPPAGRFHGFSQDDVIYLIMPDRFANGDSSNDDPAISHGVFDPKNPRMYHGGDLQGVIDRLPYLKQLGVTAIWMTPVYENMNQLNYPSSLYPAG